jgi:FG-GAP-like repeat
MAMEKLTLRLRGANIPDLAAPSRRTCWFLSNGDGTFTPQTLPNIGYGLVATADFNGDGVPDLVFPKGFEDEEDNIIGDVVFELGYQAFKSAVTDVTLQDGVSHSISIMYSGSPSYLPSASKAVTVNPP